MNDRLQRPSVINIEVTGNCPQNGKSTIAHLFAQFLSEKYPDLGVEVIMSESFSPSSSEAEIAAEKVVIFDLNTPLENKEGAFIQTYRAVL